MFHSSLTTRRALPAVVKHLTLVLLFVGFSQVTTAQVAYHIGAKPVMDLYGTSTMHDWTMSAHAFQAKALITFSADNQLSAITNLSVVLPVRNLKSKHEGMDDNAYETLKEDKFKEIVFNLKSAQIASNGGNKYSVTAVGNLTIAGTTRPITLKAAAVLNGDGSLSISGQVPLKLSEFNIERPSFVLGTMKVGDALTLNYALVLVK